MKGVIFTEFMDLVDNEFGPDVLDRILSEVETETAGAYTSVGTYDYRDMVKLVVALSESTKVEVDVLLRRFGRYLFARLADDYPELVRSVNSAFDLFKSIEDTIHVEVRKLYSDAELPKFVWESNGSGDLTLEYSSPRPFALVAEGLIQGCIEHYGGTIEVKMEILNNGHRARFFMTERTTVSG